MSFSSKARTKEPQRRKGTSSSSQISPAILFPSALYFAIRVPGFGSYPAWIMALLAQVVPMATSFSFSIRTVLQSYRESSLATAQPIAPAPIIATSYVIFSPLYKKQKRRKTKVIKNPVLSFRKPRAYNFIIIKSTGLCKV